MHAAGHGLGGGGGMVAIPGFHEDDLGHHLGTSEWYQCLKDQQMRSVSGNKSTNNMN